MTYQTITREQFRQIMPLAASRVDVYVDALNAAMAEFGIDTPLRQCAFLANVAHESGSLRYTTEIASGSAYSTRADLGNTHPEAIRIAGLHGMAPGPFWRGHGLIQITGYDNHLACGAALCLDLANHPELLATPVNAARSAAWFWKINGLDRWADVGDFDGVCDKINRGHKTAAQGDANGYADRLAYYDRALAVLGARVAA